MTDKQYKPNFIDAIGRIGGIDWRGDKKSLKALGVDLDSPVKKACQRRLNQMGLNSYRNIEI